MQSIFFLSRLRNECPLHMESPHGLHASNFLKKTFEPYQELTTYSTMHEVDILIYRIISLYQTQSKPDKNQIKQYT